MWLVIGLGNPGPRYAATRHNVGWRVIEALAGRWQAAPQETRPGQWRTWRATRDDRAVTLMEPLAFMNLSGAALAGWIATHAMPQALLVVCDDVYLPLGMLRIRPAGSSGGHNGLASIEEALGSREWPRLRFGVGAAPDAVGLRDHVLETFAADEEVVVREAVGRAADAVECWLARGLAATMNAFNRRMQPNEEAE